MIEAIADLETWGIRSTSVVRSVGVVVFDGATVLEREYFRISEANQYEANHRSDGKLYVARTVDKSTMDWWNKPENASAQEMIEQAPLISWDEARTKLGQIGQRVKNIWAKPAGFDLVMLRDLFGQDIWDYWKERDLSTLIGEFDPTKRTKPMFLGTPHNALHDAEHAHSWLINFRRALPMIMNLRDETPGGNIWSCKIGETADALLVQAADTPMRAAVSEAYFNVTGRAPHFIFSGWGAKLTQDERLVVDNAAK